MPKSKGRKPRKSSGAVSVRSSLSSPDDGTERAEVDVRPIETRYAGYLFRSRLEARWAVFFDQLKIRWEYEPQGYLIDGRPYLPDFKLMLPGDRVVFTEVKNGEVDHFEGEHVDLCRGLARATDAPVLLLTGPPTYRLYHQFLPDQRPNEFTAVFFTDDGPIINDADNYWFAQVEPDEHTGVLYFPHDEAAAGKSFGRGLVAAVNAARQARFEHGESP